MLFSEENDRIMQHINGVQFYAFNNQTQVFTGALPETLNDIINFQKNYWIAITEITGYVSIDTFDFTYQINYTDDNRTMFENAVFAQAYFNNVYRATATAGQHIYKRLPIPFIIAPNTNLSFTFNQQVALAYNVQMCYSGVRFETFEQLNMILGYNSTGA